MKDWIDRNPMTFLLYIVFIVVVIVGGLLVLLDEAGTLTYEKYLTLVVGFGGAVGVFGAGRAIKNGLNPPKDADGLPPDAPADDDELDEALLYEERDAFDAEVNPEDEKRDIHEADAALDRALGDTDLSTDAPARKPTRGKEA